MTTVANSTDSQSIASRPARNTLAQLCFAAALCLSTVPVSDTVTAQTIAMPGDPPASAAEQVSPQQPVRAFGYVVGDILNQKIPLADDLELLDKLPLNRLSTWLKRHSTETIKDKHGQFFLSIDYQIVNSPEALVEAVLPELDLYFTDGTSIEVSEWPFTIGPLTAPTAGANGSLPDRLPDTSPQFPDTSGQTSLMQNALLALAAVLAAWIGWWYWRQYNDKVRLPFAHAAHQLRKLGGTAANDDPRAWLLVHDAINKSAGSTIQPATLPELIKRRPWLAASADGLEEFFKKSSQRFFAQTAHPSTHSQSAAASDSFPLYKFCRQLMRAEKRQAA